MDNLTCTKETEKDVINTLLEHLQDCEGMEETIQLSIPPDYFEDHENSRIPSVVWKIAAGVREEWCPYRLCDWNIIKQGKNYVLTMQFRAAHLKDISPGDGTLIGRVQSA
jgi:hypothetical protein